jgi:maltose alpha-D-glucosyltransferase/alpha-amylase
MRRSPFRDVASMIRSLDYVTAMGLARQVEMGALHEQDVERIEPWAQFWHRWVSAVFLRWYIKTLEKTGLLPSAPNQLQTLLEAHVMEKILQEIGYELNNRPQMLRIPVHALLQLLRGGGAK